MYCILLTSNSFQEEQKFADQQRQMANSNATSGDLDKNTAAELAMVGEDFYAEVLVVFTSTFSCSSSR